MADVFILKFLGGLLYLMMALCALYGTWTFFRRYRQTNAAVIKAHIAAYKLQKLVEGRSR